MPLPSQILVTNTFGDWVNTTNQIILSVGNTSEHLLVTQNATPSVSTGNVSMNGVFKVANTTTNTTIATAQITLINTTSNTTIVPGQITLGTLTINTVSYTGDITGTAANATNLNSQPASYYTNASNINAGTIGPAYLPSANGTSNGAVNTAAQSFAGVKTFSANAIFSANVAVTAGPFIVGSVAAGNKFFQVDLTSPTLRFGYTGPPGASADYLYYNGTTWSIVGDTTIGSKLTVSGTSIFNANISGNSTTTFNTTNGRLVLPVGTDKWA